MRRCADCGKTKPLEAFHNSKSRLDGKHPYCRECRKRRYKKRRYNLTDKEYTSWCQITKCQLCGAKGSIIDTRSGIPHTLDFDHNHKTGKVRGVLCRSCNRSLGVLEKRGADWIKRAYKYLFE